MSGIKHIISGEERSLTAKLNSIMSAIPIQFSIASDMYSKLSNCAANKLIQPTIGN